jgi:hypothetical protein
MKKGNITSTLSNAPFYHDMSASIGILDGLCSPYSVHEGDSRRRNW